MMRIAVIGTGGVGGYFGARLARAGCEVHFAARGAHAAAIRERGLSVRSPLGDVHVHPARVLEPGAGPFDVVLVAVKLYDLEEAARGLAPWVGPETAVVTLQNGVEAPRVVARFVPPAQVFPGVAAISAWIAAPGVIEHGNRLARIRFGAPDGRPVPQLAGLEEAFRRVGVDGAVDPDITAALWRKFVFLAPFSAVTSAARARIGAVRADPRLWADFRAMVEEALALARARGVDLGPEALERVLAFTAELPADMPSSMLVDLERGRRLEVDGLVGAVVRLAREAGLEVPVSARYHARLAPFAAGAPAGAGG